jgi:hypothetical protein
LKKKAVLLIRGGTPGQPAIEERHEVPFEPGQSVLDGLMVDRPRRRIIRNQETQ